MTSLASVTGLQDGTSPPIETPYHVIGQLARTESRAMLIAMAEGAARFVAGAAESTRQTRRGLPHACHTLSGMTGVDATITDLDGIILEGPPIRMLVVGPVTSSDSDALNALTQMGIAHAIAAPLDGTKLTRTGDTNAIVDRCMLGDADVLMMFLPPGMLPTWAARLITTLWAYPSRDALSAIVVAVAPAIPQLLPQGVQYIPRSNDLTSDLADALAAITIERQCLGIHPHIRSVWRTQSLVTAVLATQQANQEPTCYLDVSEGALLVVADHGHAQIVYDSNLDIGFGTATALERLGMEQIQRWLPGRVDDSLLRQWATRRASWPEAILTETPDRAIAGAFVRAALETLIAQIPSAVKRVTRVLLGPGFLQWGSRAEAFRVVADVLPPGTNRQVAFDADNLLAVVGYLARFHPISAAALFEQDALDTLGTVMQIPRSNAQRTSQREITVTDNDTLVSVHGTENAILHVPVSRDAIVRVKAQGSDIQTSRVVGGACGILIDTRVTPLPSMGSTVRGRENVSNRLRSQTPATGDTYG